ncbi:MAG: metallopeptidase family protein [Pseudomonadota bacterium]
MSQKIIMNFTTAPSVDDLEALAQTIMDNLPEELMEFCDGVSLQLDDMPDEALEADLDLDDPFEVLALYKSGKQIAPGVESKVANDDDVLVLFRRSILDYWCESGEDLTLIMREVIIEELGKTFDFSDDEIEEMADRHSQMML